MEQLHAGEIIGEAFPYRLVRRLDAGAMAEVWLASVESEMSDARNSSEQVVLKVVNLEHQNPSFVAEAFDSEVEHLRALQHPAIVHIFPVIHNSMRNLPYRAQANLPGRPWFCSLEYLSGGSLWEVIQAAPKGLDPGYAISIAHRLAGALDYLHAKGLVHLDIKPKNILFRYPADNRLPTGATLIDFGVSRFVGQGGLSGGTREYAAPERLAYLRSDKHSSGESLRPAPSMDIYSLGIVMYQMLTGGVPFTRTDQKSVTDAIIEAKPPPPSTQLAGQVTPQVAEILDEVVLQTIRRDPDKRPTAPILAARLEEASFRLGYPHRNLFLPIRVQDDSKNSNHVDKADPAAAPRPLPPSDRNVLPKQSFIWPALVAASFLFLLLGSGIGYAVGRQPRQDDKPLETIAVITGIDDDSKENAPPSPRSGDRAEVMTTTAVTTETATPAAGAPPVTAEQEGVSSPTDAETRSAVSLLFTPTSTTTPTLTATATSTPTATPTVGRVTWARILAPENGLKSNGSVTFGWQPNGFLPSGSRYNIVLCQITSSQPQFALCNDSGQLSTNGFSISDGTRENQIVVNVSDVLRRGGRTLAERYWWAVAVYYDGQEKPAYLVSEPLTIIPE
ncbi:MAG: serine/threonine protein kinase [Caldilineaceae bacterium]|nr:serine/threonine protein kinase [Caldilineaceae bacterium]